MKKLILFAASLIIMMFATGCGVSSYMTTNQNQNTTNVVLSSDNFEVVKTLDTTVESTYIFGIGGLSRKALISNAVSELSEKANLTGSQALININVHVHNRIILIWSRKTVVVSGTVIEFTGKNQE